VDGSKINGGCWQRDCQVFAKYVSLDYFVALRVRSRMTRLIRVNVKSAKGMKTS
jgi:hypothetical protein